MKMEKAIPNNKRLAIFIKTFYRDEALYGCLESIRRFCNVSDYRIYIADDGEIGSEKQAVYKRLRQEGHIVLELPYNCGASKSRNLLLQELGEEKFILRMDDDFHFCAETNLQNMLSILEHDPVIGAVADLEIQKGLGKGTFSGGISTWQGFMDITGGKLEIRLLPKQKFKFRNHEGIQYAKCDFSRNMLLLRRELFTDVRWDEKFHFGGEHLDFLLQIKYSRWELVFTVNSRHLHREDIKYNQELPSYRRIRQKNNQKRMLLLEEKWGIKKVIIKRPVLELLKTGAVKILVALRWKKYVGDRKGVTASTE